MTATAAWASDTRAGADRLPGLWRKFTQNQSGRRPRLITLCGLHSRLRRLSQAPARQPPVDSFGDGAPIGFEHHVVTHPRDDLGLDTVCTGRRVHFLQIRAAVTFGAQDQKWRPYPPRPGQIENPHVDRVALALVLLLLRRPALEVGLAVSDEKNAARTSSGVSKQVNRFPVTSALVVRQGSRLVIRSVNRPHRAAARMRATRVAAHRATPKTSAARTRPSSDRSRSAWRPDSTGPTRRRRRTRELSRSAAVSAPGYCHGRRGSRPTRGTPCARKTRGSVRPSTTPRATPRAQRAVVMGSRTLLAHLVGYVGVELSDRAHQQCVGVGKGFCRLRSDRFRRIVWRAAQFSSFARVAYSVDLATAPGSSAALFSASRVRPMSLTIRGPRSQPSVQTAGRYRARPDGAGPQTATRPDGQMLVTVSFLSGVAYLPRR